MRASIIVLTILFALLAVSEAQAKSCSTFAGIVSQGADGKSVKLKILKGSESKFFPKPDGANTSTDKIPKKCSKKITRNTTVKVKPTGGRMTVTQFRENFSGKMRNDTDDSSWVPTNLQKLIDDKTKVVGLLRPGKGKKDAPELTTLYLPITDEEKAEIARIDGQAEDVD